MGHRTMPIPRTASSVFVLCHKSVDTGFWKPVTKLAQNHTDLLAEMCPDDIWTRVDTFKQQPLAHMKNVTLPGIIMEVDDLALWMTILPLLETGDCHVMSRPLP